MEGASAPITLPPAQRKRAMGLLFGVLLLIMIGFSVLFPVEPYYVRKFGADASTMGWIVGIYSMMQFIFAPVWGRISDRVGRKPVLMVGLLGYVIGQTLFGLAGSLWMLFAARTIAGILSAAALPTAMAYIADITPPAERAKGMGLLGAAFGLGVIIGPGIGGALGGISLALPFFLSAGIAALALVGVYSLLPESLAPSARIGKHEQRSRWSAFTWDIAALYGVTLALSLGMTGIEVTFGFFAADRLGLQPSGTGWIFVAMGVVASIVQGYMVGKLQPKLGESRMMLYGLSIAVLGFAGVAISHSAVAATVAICVLAMGSGLSRPSNSALISRRAPGGQGLAIGLMDSFDSLGRILGPLVGGYLYKVGVTMPYISGAVLYGIALVLSTTWALSVGLLGRRAAIGDSGSAG